MSTDFDVVCDTCGKTRHLGQSMGGTYSFGFGSKDLEGSRDTAEWVIQHLQADHKLRIEMSGSVEVPDHYETVDTDVKEDYEVLWHAGTPLRSCDCCGRQCSQNLEKQEGYISPCKYHLDMWLCPVCLLKYS